MMMIVRKKKKKKRRKKNTKIMRIMVKIITEIIDQKII
jgi:hypothetical protein